MSLLHYMNTKVIFTFSLSLLFLTAMAQNDSLTIVAFGNSTTAPRRGVEKVYSVRVEELLQRAGFRCKVINSGVGSSHTGSVKDNDFAKVKHGMERFDSDVLAHHPDWVIINFGLNDAYQDNGINGVARIPLKQYRKNITHFIRKIRKQSGRVILLTPNPLGSNYEEFRYLQVKKYAQCIRNIARKEHLILIDSWQLFYRYAAFQGWKQNIDTLFSDGIHPNDLGHSLIATAISEAIYDGCVIP